MPATPGSKRHARGSRGQSLVEFALVLPILLFLTMIALDFGRIYLGYVNLQNLTRIAANFAANNPTAWSGAGDPVATTRYQNQVKSDAAATNCRLPLVAGVETAPAPTFADANGNGSNTDVGDRARVQITCSFRVVTPIISNVIGTAGQIDVSASSEFPIKTGLVAPGGSGSVRPTADFTGSPTTGPSPLTVQFTDRSTGNPTAWSWDFDNDGVIDSTEQHPLHTYGGVGTFTVTLYASNAAGVSAPATRNNYISSTVAPALVNFTANPTSGTRPLVVQFTDTSTGSPTAWEWDFDNNGTVDSTLQNPVWTYTTAGTYSVKLTATNAGGPASKVVNNMIAVGLGTCTVPNFAGTSTDTAQARWNGAGFTTNVRFQQGNLPWVIQSQSVVVGLVTPCDTTITVSKN